MGQINYTNSASKFLQGLGCNQSIINGCIMNVNNLVHPINTIVQKVESSITLPSSVNILNWRKDFLNDIINDTEIWIITEDDIKSGKSIDVINRFKAGRIETINLETIRINEDPLPDLQKRESLLKEIEFLDIISDFLITLFKKLFLFFLG